MCAGNWSVARASIEFVIDKFEDDIPNKTSEITGARVIRLSLVDDGAYPKSKIKANKRADCGCKDKRLEQDVLIDTIVARVRESRCRLLTRSRPRGSASEARVRSRMALDLI